MRVTYADAFRVEIEEGELSMVFVLKQGKVVESARWGTTEEIPKALYRRAKRMASAVIREKRHAMTYRDRQYTFSF